MARFAAHSVATSHRYVGDDHQERMLDERERIRGMMKSLGSEDIRIAEVLDQIDRAVAMDMKEKVVAAVGKIHKLEQKAYEQLVHDLRERLGGYSSPASHDKLAAFLKQRKVYDQSVEKAIDQLDLFLREKHL
jgi:hypothetical protein